MRDRYTERFGGFQVDDQIELVGSSTGRSSALTPFFSSALLPALLSE